MLIEVLSLLVEESLQEFGFLVDISDLNAQLLHGQASIWSISNCYVACIPNLSNVSKTGLRGVLGTVFNGAIW